MTTDNTPQVSGGTGEPDLPNPTFSDDVPSSPSVDADAIVSKVLSQLEPLIDRKVQSTKDKRFSKFEKALGGRTDLLAELEDEGVTIPQEVRTRLQIRELQERLAEPSAQPAPRSDNGLSEPKAATTEAIAELNKYGLDANDAEFIGLLKGKYQNRAEFDLAVNRHIVKKLAPQKPANPADVVQAPATGTNTTKEQAVISEYETRLAKIRRGDTNAVASLKAEMRKKAREAGFILNI